MAKKRVHELAKDLGVPSKDLLELFRKIGMEHVKTASSGLEPVEERRVRDLLLPPKPPPPPPTPPAAPGPPRAEATPGRPSRPPPPRPATGRQPGRPGPRPGGGGGFRPRQPGSAGFRPAGTGGRPSGPGFRPGGGGAPGGGQRAGGPGLRPAPPGAGYRPGGGGRPGGGFRPGGRGQGRGRKGPRPPKSRAEVEPAEKEEGELPAPVHRPHEIAVRRGISVQDFALAIGKNQSDVIRALMTLGQMKSATESLTDEEVELVADSLGVEVRVEDPAIVESDVAPVVEIEEAEEDDPAKLAPRPAVVTVMGHVDHGKTSLLDRIRRTNVVAGEAGGITQHIGAYQVVHEGRPITFIDTPGHEAFTAMRARGAQVTDIAVLVVAANDSVMPQTIEAISHAKAAGVPIVVAVNKVDLDDADPTRVRTDLMQHDLVAEEFGGQTIAVDVSARTGQGVEQLLEYINLVAEVEDLRANPEAPARGVCIEAHLDKGRGPVATVLVKRGTLRRGEYFVAGTTWGRVRAMFDYEGAERKAAGPATPVVVMGFDDVPAAGDELRVVGDERHAKEVAGARDRRQREAQFAVASARPSLETLFSRITEGVAEKLPVIVKADVQGSLEALTEALRKLNRPDVEIDIVHRAVGGITENDVMLGQASQALVVGFNVRPDRSARELAEKEGVEIRTYDVIYQVIDDLNAALTGLLAPEYEEVVTGQAEVRQLFRVPRAGTIAGSYVLEGQVTRASRARLLREGVVIWTGSVGSLKRFKDDAREVATGFECGIGLEGYNDLKEGDVIELFEQREVART